MMNRETVLECIVNWDSWLSKDETQIIGTSCFDDWMWMATDGEPVLAHSIHDPITRADWMDTRNGVVASTPAPNKYQRTVPSTTIDVYDVLHAYSVTNPATQHAVKKLLQPGKRGHKDTLTDLREALASIQRAIQIEEQSTRG